MPFHVCHSVRSKTVNDLVTADDGHRQTPAVALKIATKPSVLSRHRINGLHRFAGLSHLLLPCLGFLCGFALGILALYLSLSRSPLCPSLCFGALPGSSPRLSLGLLLTSLCLSYTPSVLPCGSLSGSLLTGQLLGSFPGSLSFGLPAGFGFCLGLGTGDFLSNELVDTGIELGITTLLLVDNALNSLLLLLQAAHHILLLNLLVLQRFPLLFSTI